MRRWITVAVLTLVVVLGGGLAVLAVERVQHAAARVQCVNNLKQLGLSLHSYHDTNGSLPAASVRGGSLACDRRLSWLVDLWPYVEQRGRLLLDQEKPWDAEGNRQPRERWGRVEGSEQEAEVGELKVLICPSNPAHGTGPGSPALTHYVGIAGVGPESAEWGPHYPGIGVFGCDRRTRFADITDRLATTLMVAETTRANGPWTAAGPATVRGLDPEAGPYLGAAGQFSSGHRYGPGAFFSRPPVATNFVFADGSVRALTDAVAPDVLQALATIAGGEEVTPVGAD